MTTKMEKLEHRAVIKFLFLEGSSAKSIHERMVAVYNTDAPVYSTVAKWVQVFRMGHTSIEDG